MAATCQMNASSHEALDPRKSMLDYRLEIYNNLQRLDEQQEKIEHLLTSVSKHTPARDQEELEDDDFVVVEDLNRSLRRKKLVAQLQQLWRTRETLRQHARLLNIRIDSLQHSKHASLMSFEDDQEELQCEEL